MESASYPSPREARLPVAREGRRSFSIVCLSGQDWDFDLPTNHQQIMRRAAARGHQVLFVETGHFLAIHFWHLFRRRNRGSLARRLASTERVSSGVCVRKALNLVPWRQKYSLANALDCWFTARLIRRAVRRLPKPVVLWIYRIRAGPAWQVTAARSSPSTTASTTIQHGGSDRRGRARLTAEDERAAKHAQLVFATTNDLCRQKRLINSKTYLVPNAGDFDHFKAASDRLLAAPDVRDLPRPVLGFAGNFVALKVDFGLIENVALARPEWTLLLVGPFVPSRRPPSQVSRAYRT